MPDYPDWSPIAVDVQLRPEWATRIGIDKTIGCDHNILNIGDNILVEYIPAAGKVFYITDLSFGVAGYEASDRDNNQFGVVWLASPTINQYIFGFGGNGGGSHSFNAPVSILGGVPVWVIVENRCNHSAEVTAKMRGYEV